MSEANANQDRRTTVHRDPVAAERGSREQSSYDQGQGGRLAALAIVVTLHLAAALMLLYSTGVTPPPEQKDLQVVLEQTPEKPLDPPPPDPPKPDLPQPPVIQPPPPIIQIEQPKPPLPPLPQQSNAITAPAPPPPPPPPARAPGIEDSFKAAVRAAVFAAHHVPDTARLLAIFGETRVGFSLRDGMVGDIRLIGSSGHEVLDDAALEAVREARYPPVPDALRGQLLSFEIILYHRRS